MKLSKDEQKRIAAEAAVDFIKPNMIVGLGTGSTVFYAIKKIGELVQKGLSIKAISTSQETENLAVKLHIPLTDFAQVTKIELTIDGADEVDENLQLIKGGGGALLREKIVAAASSEEIIVVDEAKVVKVLGEFPLPVEVIPFGWQRVKEEIEPSCSVVILRQKDQKIFITDNGNYILDCHFKKIEEPKEIEQKLKQITGVVETGLFVNLATKVVVGKEDGSFEIILKK